MEEYINEQDGRGKNTMDSIEMENIRIQINELTKLITDLKIMRGISGKC